MTTWKVSDLTDVKPLGPLEFTDKHGDWHYFETLITPERIVFGGACNTGFLESGYILRAEGEHENDTLHELLYDLEAYYNDGPQYVSRIVCNERI